MYLFDFDLYTLTYTKQNSCYKWIRDCNSLRYCAVNMNYDKIRPNMQNVLLISKKTALLSE